MLNPLVFIVRAIGLAIGQIHAHKFRAFLTTLGIIIGVASVTAVIAALTGLEKKVLDEFSSFGASKVLVFPDRPDGVPRNQYPWSKVRLDRHDLAALEAHTPSFRMLTPQTSFAAVVQNGARRQAGVEVTGIWPTWHEIENRQVTVGRPFAATDEDQALYVCLVNDEAVTELDLPLDPVGSTLLINRRRFTIVGVVETIERMINPDTGAEIFVPFSTAAKLRDPDFFFYVVGMVKDPKLAEEAQAEARFVLRNVRQLAPDEPDTFRIEALDQYIEQFKRLSAGITAIAAGIVAVSLLVGGIGIMNIMLVSVSERTREIGLRKAVGATPRAVLAQFLLEAVTLSVLGGLIGLLCGQGIALLLTIPENGLDDATVPAWAVSLAFFFSAAVGVAFGMFPALKASRLDPIVALRSE